MNELPVARPAWREPMLWLVVALPALGVLAGVLIVVAALRSGGADALSTDVRRIGQIQQENLAPDLAATRGGLVGQLQLDPAGGVRLDLSGDAAVNDETLQLRFIHTSEARRDLDVVLRRKDGQWRGRVDASTDTGWNLRLQPADGRWRLAGRLPAGAFVAPMQALWQP